ncbi:STAS domain-containing protein, partial [Streptomyces sp. HPF1205]|uniref:STAS domain-containing protein n=1 Tax=Streptomyces sp. HPF1205 TaxID=2873262 RepID=UPI001CECCBD1
MEPLTVSADRRAGWTVLEVTGELDIATRAGLDEALAAAGPTDVVLDFSRLDFCDVTGLNLLVSARHRLRDRHGELRVVCPPGRVRRLLGVAGLTRSIPVYDTLAEAVAGGGGKSAGDR